ncbi:MAG: hemerythrin domain-containing protein [Candidatus Omnitrophica bacterium]|nr:hemerythrin domain-containing protein [Candidatus Omnitrophota bacterium]
MEDLKPTEILKEEHKVIRKMLDVLEVIVTKEDKLDDANIEDLKNIVDFIKNFADKCHHGKEEDILFPALEEAGIPKEGGPIGVMLEEHDIGRKYVRGLIKGIEEKSIVDIKENALGYINLLREHTDKEDNILYEMADIHIDEFEQKEIIEKFEKVEKKMGKGVHEKYHKLIENLAEKYLK